MKGDTLERAKHIVLNLAAYTIKMSWEIIIIDELAIEIAWEAFNLFGLYITLRIVKQMLPIAKYLPLEVKTSFNKLIEERVGQEIQRIGSLFEIGGYQLWEIRRLYQTLYAEINALKALITDSESYVLSSENLVNEPERKPVHHPVQHVTEVRTSSYCC